MGPLRPSLGELLVSFFHCRSLDCGINNSYVVKQLLSSCSHHHVFNALSCLLTFSLLYSKVGLQLSPRLSSEGDKGELR